MIRRRRAALGEWREVRVKNAQVRFLVAGRGKPVILIHGLSGSVRWWSRNIEALAQSFQVYALDLLEYETHAKRLQFALREAARKITLWMEAMDLPSAHFVGHSMGGAIAAELAAGWPARVDKLVLVNAAALFPKTRAPVSPVQLVRKAPRFSLTLIPVLLQDAWRTGPRLLWTAARDLVGSDLRLHLPRIRQKTHIVWGEHDGILPLALGLEMQRLISDSQLIVLPKAGHNPMWEDAGEFNRIVLRFLKLPTENFSKAQAV